MKRYVFHLKKTELSFLFCTFVGRKLINQTMDIEDLSVLGLYCQKENKATATLLQLINRGGVILLRSILSDLKDLSSHLICIANNPIGPEELPAEVMRTDWDGALCLIVKCPTSDII